MNKKTISIVFLFLALIFFLPDAQSQCAMCKAVAETNKDSGESFALGLNNGILYLLAVPYILLITGAVYVFRHFRSQKQE